MNPIIKEIEKVVLGAAEIMLSASEDKGVENKEGIGNIVTKYDRLVQEYLQKHLLELLPEAHFVGEEEDIHDSVNEGYAFIVDPIDGTTNFARDFSLSAISVALLKDGEPYIAVCYQPYLREIFTAEKGQGAYLNGRQIHVSGRSFKNGLVSYGNSPYYEELREETIRIIGILTREAADFRRLGSAVMDLCAVACGRMECFFELRLSPWDYAAGMLVLTEAGGTVTNVDGGKVTFDRPNSIIASNGRDDYVSLFRP